MTLKKDYRTGFNFALNLEWFNNDYITLITDIGYIQKGFKEEIMMTSVDNPESGPLKTFKTRFDYLYFSPQLKIRKEFNRIIPYVFVGPRIDYQLSYKSDIDMSAIEKDFEENNIWLKLWTRNYLQNKRNRHKFRVYKPL